MMALKLIAPIEKTFHLEQTDKEYPPDEGEKAEPTTVTIRQASQAEHEKRMDLFADVNTVLSLDDEGNQLITSYEKRNLLRVERKDTFLTISGCNIMVEDKKKKPIALFKFEDGKLAMSEAEFQDAWGQLPRLVAREIHMKVLDVNPTWRMGGEAL
ncbi:MAG: hypothetical protein ACWGQW_19675 [bacterium]